MWQTIHMRCSNMINCLYHTPSMLKIHSAHTWLHARLDQPEFNSSDVAANSAVFALRCRGTQRWYFIMKLILLNKGHSASLLIIEWGLMLLFTFSSGSLWGPLSKVNSHMCSIYLPKRCCFTGTSGVATEMKSGTSWHRKTACTSATPPPPPSTLPRSIRAHSSFNLTPLFFLFCSYVTNIFIYMFRFTPKCFFSVSIIF